MCYLVYLDPTVDKNQRNLLGTLAYRMLAKAAEAVPTNKVCLFATMPSCSLTAVEEAAIESWQVHRHTRRALFTRSRLPENWACFRGCNFIDEPCL